MAAPRGNQPRWQLAALPKRRVAHFPNSEEENSKRICRKIRTKSDELQPVRDQGEFRRSEQASISFVSSEQIDSDRETDGFKGHGLDVGDKLIEF